MLFIIVPAGHYFVVCPPNDLLQRHLLIVQEKRIKGILPKQIEQSTLHLCELHFRPKHWSVGSGSHFFPRERTQRVKDHHYEVEVRWAWSEERDWLSGLHVFPLNGSFWGQFHPNIKCHIWELCEISLPSSKHDWGGIAFILCNFVCYLWSKCGVWVGCAGSMGVDSVVGRQKEIKHIVMVFGHSYPLRELSERPLR